ncbi:MAG: XRE family transcriptional regulator, partial [Aeromonas veronii]
MTTTYTEKTDVGRNDGERFFPDMRKNRFCERLKFAMNGMANTALANMCGVSESTIRSYLQEKTTPTLTILDSLSSALSTPATWLLSGESTNVVRESKDGGIKIPMYEVDAAAGAGSWINEENVADYWQVPQSWLRLERLDHAELCIINTIGDSMTPTINNGDRLLVKLNINREKALEGVFVINLDG